MSQQKEANAWRQTLAQQIAPVYGADLGVQAVLLFGSSARGYADRYSDVEIAVFWTEPPTEEQMKQAAHAAQGTGWRFSPYDEKVQAWADEYLVRGVKIDTGHWTVGTIEAILENVLRRDDVSLPKQNTLSMLRHGVPLYGKPLLTEWSDRTADYPENLARVMVQNHLQFGPFSSHEMLAERDEVPLLYENFCHMERKILAMLMGLNRIYYPGFKWTRYLTDEMTLAPPLLFPRLTRVFRTDPVPGAREMRQLIEETFALVETHMPEIDVTSARKRFEEPYAAWDGPPGFRQE